MKGVPLRVEMGPRDLEKGECVVVSRDNREKTALAAEELAARIPGLLDALRDRLFERARENRERRTFAAETLPEMIEIANRESGFIKASWCGELACEEALKEQAGVTSRCMPFDQSECGEKCVACGKPAKKLVYWGKAY